LASSSLLRSPLALRCDTGCMVISCPGARLVPPARDVSITDEPLKQGYESVQTTDVESASEFEESNQKRSHLRVAAVGIGVAALVAVLFCSASYRNRKRPLASQDMDGLVNYVSTGRAPVAPWIKPKPKLCDIGVVLDFCLRLNQQSPSYYGGNATSSKAVVNASVLSEYFMAGKGSVTRFLKRIGAVNVAKEGDYTVTCQSLCEKTVASFPAGELPGMVDVGCYIKLPAISPTCAVDVGLTVISRIDFPRGSQILGRQFLEKPDQPLTEEEQGLLQILDNFQVKSNLAKYAALAHPDVDQQHLQLAAARLFRIFPASRGVSLRLKSQTELVAPRKLWDDSCATARDGTCDVPYSCADGTDCTDCGTCHGRLPSDSCITARDDRCDEPRYCLVGTDCTDCDSCGLGGEALYARLKRAKPNDSCEKANDGTCNPECEDGTDCTDCNTCRMEGEHWQPAQYVDEVLQAGAKVQAMLAAALIGLASGAGSNILLTLVGKDEPQIRLELKRMIAGLMRLLDDVKYVYPGEACQANTYAYIEVKDPGTTMNLCDSFMSGNPYEQYISIIEVLLHAKDLLAETQRLRGKPVFGIDMVKDLAAQCRKAGGDICAKSVRNAQTVLYVVNSFLKLAL